MIKFTVLLLFFFVLFIKKNVCWSDEVHMIITAIALDGLTDKERRILNRILLNYKEDKDFNDKISASIWADHLKPNEFNPFYPNAVRRVEILDIFSDWHYVSTAYNPTKINLPSYYLNAQKGKYNAIGVLKHIYKTLVQVQKKAKYGTFFSYNFYLRFFIHIFADLHQPMHAILFFNKNFPHGDKGGLEITLSYHNYMGNLHHLCDNIFNSRKKRWPLINTNDAEKDAHLMMSSYPPISFHDRILNPSDKMNFIDSIAGESHELAVNHIYSHFPLSTLSKDVPIKVNQHFVLKLKELLNKQMIIAGYRLSYYLRDMLLNVPDDL
ncbi:p1/s1 nuclease, putative [Plasmodium relictum]|uniref:p1/s1 nuclease, putative n=1 Tax=Plasmodium relictum TaxID=85471 RepID=A0A1J1HDF5_PLARL|nr:p1/s1 nuclease, putative [Plasmodium relictum]CRH04017.1 p1/s1 nuclease, putative [Plasmodium relictum]